MQRKGQAAMEFLMTYGWAILAAIIAIAVLAYFGIFNPGRYVSNICTINAPFSCEEYSIMTTGIALVIRNGYGDSVDVSSINVAGCGTSAAYSGVADGAVIGAPSITINCALTGKFKGDITITYMKTGGTLSQTSTGSISGRAV